MSRQRLPVTLDADRKLTQQQQLIIDHVLTTGETIKQTSVTLGLDIRNIYRTLALPHVKKELHQRTLEHIGILAPFAAKVQQQLLQSESDHVKASVAENILDRHLGKPVMRQQVSLQGQIHVVIDLA
jgi:hypothetical protein